MMNAEPSADLDTWCFWLNVSLEPLGYSAHVTPTDPSTWFYMAPEVIRVDDVQRHSPLRGFLRILWPDWIKSQGTYGVINLRWEMDPGKYGDMADAAFDRIPGALDGFYIPRISWIMREEIGLDCVNPINATPENLALRIVRIFDAPPLCPCTILAREKEKELNISYDWSPNYD